MCNSLDRYPHPYRIGRINSTSSLSVAALALASLPHVVVIGYESMGSIIDRFAKVEIKHPEPPVFEFEELFKDDYAWMWEKESSYQKANRSAPFYDKFNPAWQNRHHSPARFNRRARNYRK